MSQMMRPVRPVVDNEKCTGCGICVTFCPEGTLLLDKGKAIFDLRYCKGCGICAFECPLEAIKMEREE